MSLVEYLGGVLAKVPWSGIADLLFTAAAFALWLCPPPTEPSPPTPADAARLRPRVTPEVKAPKATIARSLCPPPTEASPAPAGAARLQPQVTLEVKAPKATAPVCLVVSPIAAPVVVAQRRQAPKPRVDPPRAAPVVVAAKKSKSVTFAVGPPAVRVVRRWIVRSVHLHAPEYFSSKVKRRVDPVLDQEQRQYLEVLQRMEQEGMRVDR
ncbi:MAG: hypothetical protein M1826_002450 [Phylliscum demangeonii]|nr:MAG: hypothetical protein M1826_002450 [Phylliscum demangeonii]